ncbi:uncharacterized protein C8Q71DRAFT_903415 [Rhodofomes roseus]|uniref:Uncharacterized protein n=1 Tax=Rhodofomes roseus TaxID=34475 RepID=A0ABQ8KYG0_9APHY|nr:uncharacterized protein C8Q71DRAFT_903415 [Rhodofomes roseus]KAH9844353.1 hypothetical protein C8Q71DRAFT_903415 [Rhodofomes roseus]
MNSPGIRPTRGRHRKQLSALRLSSDSTVTTLPPYTSPPWSKHASLDMSDSDRPPDYPDSAEEADADTDSDEDIVYVQPPLPQLAAPRGSRIRRSHSQLQSPRSHSNSHSSSFSQTHRRQQSTAGSSDPYLDSLLARSVHALEMSNVLLQSSMSTQSSLSAVLQNDPIADLSLEARAQMLSRRVSSGRGAHGTWSDDLDEIYRGVEDLVGPREGVEEEEEVERISKADMCSLSRSAPASSFEDNFSKGPPTVGAEERVQVRRRPSLRRPSLDSMGGSHLEYSNHDRSHFVAPAPRALTIYVDSTDDPDSITLPPTLGLRTTAHFPPTPLPLQTTIPDTVREVSLKPSDSKKSIVDVLSSYVAPPPAAGPSGSASSSPRFSIMSRSGRSSSTSSGSKTVRRVSQSKSPPATTSPSFRSRSLTPMRTATPPRAPRPMTPPIEELSASSSSSSSETLHVDRTLESLRTILGKQPPSAISPSSSKSTPPPLPRPSLLAPPTVEPVSGTSNATASISRLFTKSRHSSSTRPPSPPRQSVLKNRSAPPTPTFTAPPTPSIAGFPEPFAGLHLSMPSVPGLRSSGSSGRSTPKRISFAELPESYAGSKPGGAPSKFKGKERAKGVGKGKGKGKDDEDGGWWTGWLLGAAGTGSGAGLSMGAAREERVRSPGWSTRPGYVGGGWEEWGA